jgi:biopolymer transport protein ExbD
VDNQPATLAAALRQFAGGGEPPPALTISADAEATHQSVVTAMDVAGRSGFREISIATVRAGGDRD